MELRRVPLWYAVWMTKIKWEPIGALYFSSKPMSFLTELEVKWYTILRFLAGNDRPWEQHQASLSMLLANHRSFYSCAKK